MKIVVDAMGGDFGPRVTVEGAVRASEDYGVEVVLLGVESAIKKEVDKLRSSKAKITIIDAPEAIGMGDKIYSLRKKKGSSILVGAQLVKDKAADAFVSMGSTAAVVFISKRVMGSLKGVDRPALALIVPAPKGLTLLIDVGANANCRPRDLEQFAIMGRLFMEANFGIKNPRIGLMSIGEERSKGNELTREAFKRIAAAPLNFIGNVEGRDIYSGKGGRYRQRRVHGKRGPEGQRRPRGSARLHGQARAHEGFPGSSRPLPDEQASQEDLQEG